MPTIGISEEEARKRWAANGNNATGWVKNADGSWTDGGSEPPPSSGGGYLENGYLDNGNNPLNADGSVAKKPRYSGETSTDESDPIAASYARLAAPPSNREGLRAQAIRDIQTQLDAQAAFYAKQREVEQRRLNQAADLSAAKVNALGLQRGLSGSSVAEAEKGTQAAASAEEERLSMSKLNAEEANARAALTGAATSSADEQYAAALLASQNAEIKRNEYLASLIPAAKAPITVSAGQSVIDPQTGEVIYQAKPEDSGKSYTLSPGQTVVDGTGKVLYTAPAKEEAVKTYTVSAGQTVVDADGKVIYQSKPEDSGKTYTLSPGQTVVDGSGRIIFSAPSDKTAPTITLSPGQSAFDSKGTIIAAVPASESQAKSFTLSPGQTVFDSNGKPIASLPGAPAPTYKNINGVDYQVGPNGQLMSPQVPEATASELIAASSQPDSPSNLLAQLKALKLNPGLGAAVGKSSLFNWIPGTPAYDFKTKFDSIISLMTLPNLKLLKGAMSDKDIAFLKAAASSLALGTSEPAFKAELDRVIQNTENIARDFEAKLQAAKSGAPMPGSAPTGGGDELDSALDSAGFKREGGGSANAQSDLKKVTAAIGQFESGGNYKAIGNATSSGDRAYGKYQVMGANIPSWTKAALGRSMTPQEFLNDPAAQDKVAEHFMGQHLARYGNLADVASVWFSGKPVSQAGNVKDVNGTSVPSYVRNVQAIYNKLG